MVTSCKPIVIVGAGHAGFQLAASLRQCGYEERIALINNEPYLPYQRPPLSKAFLKGNGDLDAMFFRSESFFRHHRIELIDDHVAAIDRADQKAVLRSGSSLAYRHLVLATGARNRVLRMPNADHDGVRHLRSLADGEAIRERLDRARRVVVIGAGFVGLEFAATAAAKGIEIDIVELAPRIMARVVSPAISSYFHARHETAGCRIHRKRSVAAIAAKNGRLQGVTLDDDRWLAADLVVVGIGVVPNVELATAAGLSATNGIDVDQHFATIDPHISAIGDCALFSSPRYKAPLRLESVSNATDQAKCLAARLTGHMRPFNGVPWFWSDQGDDKLQIVGLVDGHRETIVRGEPERNSFSVFCYDGGRLLGVESVNRAADHMAARRLVAEGATVHPDQAADLSFDLNTLRQDPGQPG
ncbi:FAD-dependent oxidoreductase [Xanthobacter sp. KR7-225]|uniref:NAD(P)/FAD-dependent oxidoreductase n=1 Tax=Xanthobacter sp. KR7-225 TaxID=3156613 RepID=UPI0032B47D1D